MKSSLTFGNYQLLQRIAAGERITVPRWSVLVTDRLVFIRTGPVEAFAIAFELTRLGRLELRKESPEFPKLGRTGEEGVCRLCGQRIVLCVGEMK